MSKPEEIKLSQSAMRKLNYIFKRNEQKKILNEASFYRSIYSAVDDKIILEAVIEKNLKTKIYKVLFLDNQKQIKEYNEYLKEVLELDENSNNNELIKYIYS